MTKRNARDSRRGSAMIEFALSFLLFMALVVGVFDIGRAVWAYSTTAHAAKMAARFAMTHGTSNKVTDGNGNDVTAAAVKEMAVAQGVGLGLSTDDVTVTYDPSNIRGGMVTVQVNYDETFIAGPLVGLGSSITIGGRSTMVIGN